MRFQMTTQAQIDANRDRVRAEFAGKGFRIDSNGKGIRAECDTCHESNTLNPESWMRRHGHAPRGRVADFSTVTLNADGTRDRVLYYA